MIRSNQIAAAAACNKRYLPKGGRRRSNTPQQQQPPQQQQQIMLPIKPPQQQQQLLPRRGTTETTTTTQPRRHSHTLSTSTVLPSNKGFRKDYQLGETMRNPSHMIFPGSVRAVDTLKAHDYAFVKRSNGSYSYAILAYRTKQTLTFVMCNRRSMKHVGRKHWSDFVRLVSEDAEEESGSVVEVEEKESSLPATTADTANSSSSSAGVSNSESQASSNSQSQSQEQPIIENDDDKFRRELLIDDEDNDKDRQELMDLEYIFYRKLMKKEWVPWCVSFVPVGDDDDDSSVVSDVSIPKFPATVREEI